MAARTSAFADDGDFNASASMTEILEFRARKWRAIAVLSLGLALGIVAVLPLSDAEGFCPLRHWLGIPCLLCGGTRATQALLHGNLERALYLNQWATLAVGGAMIWALPTLFEAGTGRRILPLFQWSTRRVTGLVLILLLCWGLHVRSAFITPKPELLNERSVASEIRAWFSRA